MDRSGLFVRGWDQAHQWPQVPDADRLRRLHQECPALVADPSISGLRVARELEWIIEDEASQRIVDEFGRG
jgi:hypothetical protein